MSHATLSLVLQTATALATIAAPVIIVYLGNRHARATRKRIKRLANVCEEANTILKNGICKGGSPPTPTDPVAAVPHPCEQPPAAPH